MKKAIFLKLFVLLMFSVISCTTEETDEVKDTENKEETNNEDTGSENTSYLFKATVDGTAYTSTKVQGVIEDGIILFSTRVNEGADLIQISVSQNIKAGSYDLTNKIVTINLILAKGTPNTFLSTSGTFKVVSNNTDTKTFTATFDATLKDAFTGKVIKKITSAKLTNVSYTLSENTEETAEETSEENTFESPTSAEEVISALKIKTIVQ